MDEVKVFADVDGDATNANAVSATGVLSAEDVYKRQEGSIPG